MESHSSKSYDKILCQVHSIGTGLSKHSGTLICSPANTLLPPAPYFYCRCIKETLDHSVPLLQTPSISSISSKFFTVPWASPLLFFPSLPSLSRFPSLSSSHSDPHFEHRRHTSASNCLHWLFFPLGVPFRNLKGCFLTLSRDYCILIAIIPCPQHSSSSVLYSCHLTYSTFKTFWKWLTYVYCLPCSTRM